MLAIEDEVLTRPDEPDQAQEDPEAKNTAAPIGASHGWRNWVMTPAHFQKRKWFEPLYEKRIAFSDWERSQLIGIIVNSPRRSEVDVAIAGSRWILDLDNDWDEQGAVAYSKDTWLRACDFLRRQAAVARQMLGLELPPPKILPGPNGSIDIHWKTSRFELLVNVPADPTKPATFYGDNYGAISMGGNFAPSQAVLALIAWLLD